MRRAAMSISNPGTGAVGKAEQGYSVALSADGNTAIVGGLTDNSGTGSLGQFCRLFGTTVPSGPGFGVKLDEAKLRKYRWE